MQQKPRNVKKSVVVEPPNIGVKVDVKVPKMSVTGEILEAGMKIHPPKLSVTGHKINVGIPKDVSTYHQKEHHNYGPKIIKMKDFISQDFKAPIYDVKEVPHFGIYKKKK